MKKEKNLPAIILARGGSEALLGKNIRGFAGKPLLAWSILQALESRRVSTVYVSSDCQEILRVAKSHGAKVLLRPDNLSGNKAACESGWLHAIKQIQQITRKPPPVVIALRATSPLREPSDIDGAIELFEKDKADSLFSSTMVDDLGVWSDKDGVLGGNTFDSSQRVRGQDRRSYYLENGSIYIFKTSLLQRTGNRLGGRISHFSMPYWKSFEIHDKDTFEICEGFFLKKLHIKNTPNIKFRPKLIVYDFDGVMTNNHALITQTGSEAVWVNRSDGWGIQELRKAGIYQVILSTEKNPVVAARARKLKIGVVQGSQDKAKGLRNICRAHGVLHQEVLFVGNDVNDLPAMRLVGLSVSPADGHPEVLKHCCHITKAKGGEGVIREIADLILTGKNSKTTRR